MEKRVVQSWLLYAMLVSVGAGVGGGGASWAMSPQEKLARLEKKLDGQTETLAGIKEALVAQDERLKAFWARTWPTVEQALADHEARLRKLEGR